MNFKLSFCRVSLDIILWELFFIDSLFYEFHTSDVRFKMSLSQVKISCWKENAASLEESLLFFSMKIKITLLVMFISFLTNLILFCFQLIRNETRPLRYSRRHFLIFEDMAEDNILDHCNWWMIQFSLNKGKEKNIFLIKTPW